MSGRNDINKAMTEYMNVKADDVEQADIPFAFISFPSAKDPEYDRKYPGWLDMLNTHVDDINVCIFACMQ